MITAIQIRLLKDMAKSDKCPVDKVVCSSLPKAIRFYKKNGFRKIHKVVGILDHTTTNDDDTFIEGQWRMEWVVRSKAAKHHQHHHHR